ncbi:MAG: hypothetical protein LBL13_13465 [Bacteroidales bacterium]|jgi:hypothetical protein|nr:hypothetical protein [Bacteroidales bacterium]
MEYSKEYNDNLKRFNDVINFKPIDRTLHFSNFYTWKVFDCDTRYKLSEAMVDFDKIEHLQCEFHERYRFDTHMDYGTRNTAIGTSLALGSSHYVIDDNAEVINFYDHAIMEGDEYEEFSKDPERVHWRIFQRKHPGVTKGQVVKAIMRNIENGEFQNHIVNKFVTKYNCPGVLPNNSSVGALVQSPIERFGKYYRGIREMSMDLRRHKKELLMACDAIHEKEALPTLRAALKSGSSVCFSDTFCGLLVHATMSLDQWEEFYWPYLKQYFDEVVAAGKTINVYSENSISRFAKYFKDYPKGHIAFIIELDDLIELRKELPNVCLIGGMTSELLGYGTPQQCIDRVKRLEDNLKEGFILSQDKMVSFRQDCKRENLLAISEYLQGSRK